MRFASHHFTQLPMRLRLVPSALALALLAATPAAAQKQKHKVKHVQRSAPIDWEARPVGTYELTFFGTQGANVGILVVTDSAGALKATLTREGDPHTRPTDIAVKGTDLTLGTNTPRGQLTVVLHRKDDRIGGHWASADNSEGAVYARKLR